MALGDSIVAVFPHMKNELNKAEPTTEPAMRAWRSDLFNLAKQITTKAEAENRDLTDNEHQAFQELATLADYWGDRIREESGEYNNNGAHKPTPRGYKKEEPKFKIYNNAESIVQSLPVAQRRQEESESHGVSIGALVRAMALGKNSNKVSENAMLTIGEASDSLGGVTVPTFVTREYIDLLRSKNRAMQAGASTAILAGKTVIAKVVKDPKAGWRSENEAVNKTDITFDKAELIPKSLAVIVVVSRELLEDSINIEEIITTSLAECMASALDSAIFYGAGGVKEPLGIANVQGVLSISMGENGAPVSNYSPLIKAMAALAANNANDPTAAVMNPNTYFDLAELADTTGQPMRKPEVLTNLPLLHTNKVPVNETHGTAVNTSHVIMGNFADVIVGIRTDFRLELLRELYAENMQFGFLASLRADVAVSNPESFCLIKGITPKVVA